MNTACTLTIEEICNEGTLNYLDSYRIWDESDNYPHGFNREVFAGKNGDRVH